MTDMLMPNIYSGFCCQFVQQEQLAAGTGEQDIPEGYAAAPIYVAVKGRVFDVSFGGVSHYGKGCGYHIFAGRDASRALAKMSFEQEHLDHPAISDLTPDERKVLDDWTIRFEKKGYCVVGTYAITE
jgi:membrane-associated progesterone receptor component